jgi:hypothetical protein
MYQYVYLCSAILTSFEIDHFNIDFRREYMNICPPVINLPTPLHMLNIM